MKLPFLKTQAIGNDFVLVAEPDLPPDLNLEDLAVDMCERRTGVGSDGLLVLAPGKLRMFNPDGTEDFCGNGLRCAIAEAHRRGWAELTGAIHHLDRFVAYEVLGEDCIRTEFAPASFTPADVPTLALEELFQTEIEIVPGQFLRVSTLSTGSAHTVIFMDELPDDPEFFGLSPVIENHPLFPERTSVIWAHPLGEDRLQVRIFERGVGETLGCGTGSAATAVAWSRASGVTGGITVVSKGGEIQVGLDRWDGPIQLTSRVEAVFRGEWPLV